MILLIVHNKRRIARCVRQIPNIIRVVIGNNFILSDLFTRSMSLEYLYRVCFVPTVGGVAAPRPKQYNFRHYRFIFFHRYCIIHITMIIISVYLIILYIDFGIESSCTFIYVEVIMKNQGSADCHTYVLCQYVC